MNYGFEPAPRTALMRAFGTATGIAIGFLVGYAAMLAVFAFAASLRAAYPPWNHGVPAILEIVVLSMTAAGFGAFPIRNPHASGTARVAGYSAIATLAFFVCGGFIGLVDIAGAHVPFYIAPGIPQSGVMKPSP